MKIRSSNTNSELKKIFFLLAVVMFVLSAWFVIKKQYKSRSYSIFIEFDNAHGICPGTPLRLRGINIGSVIDLTSEINSVIVLVDINNSSITIPKNSLIETNQTGLLNDTAIDILPLDLLSERSNKIVSPLSSECFESRILCHLSYVEGERGLNYDDLIRATTRISQRFDDPRFFNILYTFLQNGIEFSDNIVSISSDISSFISTLADGVKK
jgi:phospholipid/cholesterol/gamma-HCH transport system substrate-binding protein